MSGAPAVLVTVADAQGSAPREVGADMLVLADRIVGTIGGGHLEYSAIATARAMLADGAAARLEDYALGPALGQCCGGRVTLLFEDAGRAPARSDDAPSIVALAPPFARRTLADGAWPAEVARTARTARTATMVTTRDGRFLVLPALAAARATVMLFGAGHVGRAVATALAALPLRLVWVDQRRDAFPAAIPDNATAIQTDSPLDMIAQAPPDACFLVMTHSHALDLEICATVLERGAFVFAGLIGSASKRARFAKRLRARALPAAMVERLTCPIGVAGITGKQPAVIAASVAAQLLQVVEARAKTAAPPRAQAC